MCMARLCRDQDKRDEHPGFSLRLRLVLLFWTSMAQRTASTTNEDIVSRPLDDTAVMQSDGGVDQIAAERAQPRKRPLLVGSGKLAVSGHVRRENCREFPGLGHGRSFTAEESSTAHRS